MIERLKALGVDQKTAIEAWLQCDRIEERAANYLFDKNVPVGFGFWGGIAEDISQAIDRRRN